MYNNNRQDYEGQIPRIESPRIYYVPATGIFQSFPERNVEYLPMYPENRNSSNNTPRAVTGRMPNANNYYPRGLGARQQADNDFAARVNNNYNYNYNQAYRYGEIVYHSMGRCPYIQCPWHYISPAYVYYPIPPQATGLYATASPVQCYQSAYLQLPAYRPTTNFAPTPAANVSSQLGARHSEEGRSTRNSGRARPARASPGTARTYSEVVASAENNRAEHPRTLPATGSPRMRPAQSMEGSVTLMSGNRNCGFDFELLDNAANAGPGNSLLIRRISTGRFSRAAFRELFSTTGTSAHLESRQSNSASSLPPPLPPRAAVADVKPNVSSFNSVEVGRLIDVDSNDDDDDVAAQFQQKPFAYFDRKPKN